MISSVNSAMQNDAMQLLRERRMKTADTAGAWDKLAARADNRLQADKEAQEKKKQLPDIGMEQAENAILKRVKQDKSNVPYSYLAKDGLIEYNGVVFVCDEEHHAICLGDMTDQEEVINIPLTEGGCLKVNRDSLSALSKAITMFSPSDIRRIMETIARDTKCEQMKLQLDEDSNSIGDSAEAKMDRDGADAVTPEQVALLLRDREKDELL